MKLGLQIIEFNWPGGPQRLAGQLRDVAVAAEQSGLSSLWVMDHFFQMPGMPGGAPEPMVECYTTLGFLAAATTTIELGPLVGGVIYRYPGILVKAATTLNVLSNGRSWFTIGAGWYEREAVGLGVPFPPLRDRFALVEDTLRLARQMWSDAAGTPFEGSTITVPEPLNNPPAVRPRILVGGEGEKRTLRLVAEYADACNLFAGPARQWPEHVPAIRHKLAVLDGHCADVGRDPATIERTALGTVDFTTDSDEDVVRGAAALAEAGIDHLIVNMPPGHDTAAVHRLGALPR